MDSDGNFLNEKHIKNQKNKELHSPQPQEATDESERYTYSPECAQVLEKHLDEKSNQHLKDIFEKTEAMKKVAAVKNEQLEQQFVDLKHRLSTSSQYLLKIKKNIENLKFSYQKEVLEMHNALEPSGEPLNRNIRTSEDMAKHMEDIRKKIDNLQSRTKAQTQKHQTVAESYKTAFQNVVKALQDIENGSYSSCAKT